MKILVECTVAALFSSIVDNIVFNVPLYLFQKQKWQINPRRGHAAWGMRQAVCAMWKYFLRNAKNNFNAFSFSFSISF